MIETILFDLDGTLTDPAEGITKSVAYALGKYGIYVADLSVLHPFIGPPLSKSFEYYFDFSPEQAKEAVDIYREYFSEIGIFENEVYPGIEDCLGALCDNSKTLVLATSKPEPFAKQILKHFNLSDYFSFIAGNTMEESRPEKIDVLKYIFQQNPQFDPKETVMVGDRCYDILAAKELGVLSVGVDYGYAAPRELEEAGADYIVSSPEELKRILLGL